MKNLWPTNLFPLSLLGPGLRIDAILETVRRRISFSGRIDPVRIYVEQPEEQTMVLIDSETSHVVADETRNKVMYVESENTFIDESEDISNILLAINNEKTVVIL